MFTKNTFSDCKTSLAYRYGETSAPSSGDANRNWWINRAVQYIAPRLNLRKSVTLTVSGGVTDLPDDFIQVYDEYSVTKDGAVVGIIASDQADLFSGSVFWITGNQKDGYVFNAKEDGDYTVWYTFRPENMVANDDVCIIPDIEAVVSYAYGMLRKSETDPLGDASASLDETERRIAQMNSDHKNNQAPLQMRIQ